MSIILMVALSHRKRGDISSLIGHHTGQSRLALYTCLSIHARRLTTPRYPLIQVFFYGHLSWSHTGSTHHHISRVLSPRPTVHMSFMHEIVSLFKCIGAVPQGSSPRSTCCFAVTRKHSSRDGRGRFPLPISLNLVFFFFFFSSLNNFFFLGSTNMTRPLNRRYFHHFFFFFLAFPVQSNILCCALTPSHLMSISCFNFERKKHKVNIQHMFLIKCHIGFPAGPRNRLIIQFHHVTAPCCVPTHCSLLLHEVHAIYDQTEIKSHPTTEKKKEKKLAQLTAVDMQHAPAKLPSKLNLFVFVNVLVQSLCSLHSDCASNFASWDFLHVNYRQLSVDILIHLGTTCEQLNIRTNTHLCPACSVYPNYIRFSFFSPFFVPKYFSIKQKISHASVNY
ncbi:hypothetical protein VP01_390g2 [Puccinia sorghi]|uniref:Uncharacterized protein n=1 Tax=Puccinia sorghi TaxID=27349 RepID=A0A0L6UUK6_9BASI|nr:hypothetical protein VP01_390g2 [Puccinia sorghi]